MVGIEVGAIGRDLDGGGFWGCEGGGGTGSGEGRTGGGGGSGI